MPPQPCMASLQRRGAEEAGAEVPAHEWHAAATPVFHVKHCSGSSVGRSFVSEHERDTDRTTLVIHGRDDADVMRPSRITTATEATCPWPRGETVPSADPQPW